MKCMIELTDETILALAQQAHKEGVSIEELIASRLDDAVSTLVDLNDQEIEDLVLEVAEFAIEAYKPGDTPFTLVQIFRTSRGSGVWTAYSTSTRKKLGRRFKALVDERIIQNGVLLKMTGKTITNSALYAVVRA